MNILPINNTNSNTNFKAKFPKKYINQFIKEVEFKDVDDVPKLYTMLNFIKQQQGKTAKIKNFGLWNQIQIDGKSLTNERKYFTAIHALEDATVNHKNTLIKDTPLKRLSEDEFEQEWIKNSKKTKTDIENLYED